MEIDTGDTVLHKPTGEEWLVAGVKGDRLMWCGWPEGWAKLAECELVEKATPEARDKLLHELRETRLHRKGPAAMTTYKEETNG